MNICKNIDYRLYAYLNAKTELSHNRKRNKITKMRIFGSWSCINLNIDKPITKSYFVTKFSIN